jgi:tetratricopeptide (TPR) repeat protein
MPASGAQSFDIFFSYSRADNANGLIARFVECIHREVERSLNRPLRPFFDVHAIEGMDDWRHRILEGLRKSRVFAACVSPAFLTSAYCEWEFVEYLRNEAAQMLAGQGVAPIYAFDVPYWSAPDFDQTAPPWVSELRRRQFFDFRTSFGQWDTSATSAGLELIRKLAGRIRDRIVTADRAEQSPGSVDGHNYLFTGRKAEIGRVREYLLKAGAAPAMAVIHGLGGIGKTSLAVEYAHSYAHEYGGGRWQVHCPGLKSVTEAFAALAPALGIEFREVQNADHSHRAQRVVAELSNRAAAASRGICLLLLDNVLEHEMFAPASMQRLPSATWLHLLITTPLGPAELPDLDPRMFIALDEMSEDDALALIERYQPNGRFSEEDEREAARKIARLLDGYPLAVEAAAVFLGQSPGTSCNDFVGSLESEGLSELESAALGSPRGMRHGEKRLTATLQPLLSLLDPEARCALEYASLMPPGCVVWEWVESLTGDDFPEIENAAPLGVIDRWALVRNRLESLRLIVPGGELWAGRIHSLVQEVIWLSDGFDYERTLRRLIHYALGRCTSLERDWENRAGDWEIEALHQWSLHLMSIDELGGGLIESRTADLLHKLGRYLETEGLRRHVLSVRERLLGPEDPKTLSAANALANTMMELGGYAEAESLYRRTLVAYEALCGSHDSRTLLSVSGLGQALYYLGEYSPAEPYLKRALVASERVLGEEHPDTLVSVNNLAFLYASQGRYTEAEPFYQRALAASERVLGEEHPSTLVSVNNLAFLYARQGRYTEAEPLYQRALAARERVLGEEHPSTLVSVNGLAALYESQGRYTEAEPLYQRALAARERVLGEEHPDTLVSVNDLAGLYARQGRYTEAEPLYQRALAASERVLGEEHR